MSSEWFEAARTPLTTPERARDVAQLFKVLADKLTELGDRSGANVATSESQWWLTYAATLSQTGT